MNCENCGMELNDDVLRWNKERQKKYLSCPYCGHVDINVVVRKDEHFLQRYSSRKVA